MPSHLTCDIDGFGAAMDSILEDVLANTEKGMEPAVRESCKTGRKLTKANAAGSFGGTGKYASSFSYRIKKSGDEVTGEVGSRNMPGLVHLLEKGHAKVGGGRVEGRPHMAPAAEEAFKVLEDEINKALENL